MAKAKKLPSGSWRVLLYVGTDDSGKRQYESITAPTEAEANLLAAKRRYDIDRGVTNDRSPEQYTVREAVEKYIADRDEIFSPKTVREARAYLRLHFTGIHNVKIKDLTAAKLQAEINREAKHYAPKTLHNVHMLFAASIKAAMPDKQLRVILPQVQRREMQIPTAEQLMHLLESVEGKPIEIPILLGATCGMRRGEICALDLDHDIDYEQCRISITKTLALDEDNTWHIKAPKTVGSARVIDCPAWVVDKINTARTSGYKMQTPPAVSDAFRSACKHAGISGIRFHDLRHYYASLMLRLNVPDKYAMQRMGHSTPNMLKTVYQHIMDDKNQEISAQINRYFDAMQHEMQHEIADTDENTR